MKQVVKLSMDMLDALIDIERAGIKISNEKLAKIKEDYQTEYDQLYSHLMDIAEITMGDYTLEKWWIKLRGKKRST